MTRAEALKQMKFKQQFKHLNYYSMPDSIGFVLRKRLNLLCNFFIIVGLFLYSFFLILLFLYKCAVDYKQTSS